MAAPQNFVQAQGQGQVSADQMNSVIQWAGTVPGLRGFTGVPNMVAEITGYAAPNDGGQGFFYYDPNATAPDDNGVTTVQPTGVSVGAWIRIPVIVSGGFLPRTGQMSLTSDTNWASQAGIPAGTFWIPWSSLATADSGDDCPAFNPDNMLSLTTPVPAVSGFSPPGATFPGITIPEAGFYCVYAQIVMTSDGTFNTTVQDQICIVTVQLRPSTVDLVSFFDSDNEGSLSSVVDTLDAFTLHSRGVMQCEAGDVIFMRIDSNLSTTQYTHYVVAGFSFFGVYKVR